MTLIFAMLNIKTGAFSFASAGHPAPFILRASASNSLWLLTSPAIGVQDQSELDAYPTEQVELEPGDPSLLFTDGIAEVRDPAGRFFEETRMADALEELKHRRRRSSSTGFWWMRSALPPAWRRRRRSRSPARCRPSRRRTTSPSSACA